MQKFFQERAAQPGCFKPGDNARRSAEEPQGSGARIFSNSNYLRE